MTEERNLVAEAQEAWAKRERPLGTSSTPPPDWVNLYVITEVHKLTDAKLDNLNQRLEVIERAMGIEGTSPDDIREI